MRVTLAGATVTPVSLGEFPPVAPDDVPPALCEPALPPDALAPPEVAPPVTPPPVPEPAELPPLPPEPEPPVVVSESSPAELQPKTRTVASATVVTPETSDVVMNTHFSHGAKGLRSPVRVRG
jgi:hypothetical protein